MSRKLAILLLITALMLPGLAGAVTKEDFLVKTTGNLVNLLTAPADDPLRREAINFGEGYVVGAYHYYVAENSGPKGQRLVCLPDPPPSRDAAVTMFVEWVKAHPQYMDENPVETLFRFLIDKWPCKR